MSSMNRLLIQVVPRLQPGRCGISDHGLALAQELRSAFGIDSAFAVVNAGDPGKVDFPGVRCAAAELPGACLSLSEGRSGALLVHVSGYGYSPDGDPAALAAALQQIQAGGRLRIAVYFHELFAVGPPWKSAFWHSRRQQKSACAIAGLGDLLVTNTRQHAQWLERQLAPQSSNSVKLLPVFSTVGHAHEPAPLAARDPVMAVFGLPGSRRNAYRQLRTLGKMLDDLGVRKILDIGPALDAPPAVKGIAVERIGELSAADLRQTLSSARFGFVAYPPFCLAKSSIVAGYCAQGAIPVLADPFRGDMDGLTDGTQVVSPASALSAKASGWEACSRAAWTWYMAHRLEVHAEQYAHWMGQAA